MEVKRSWRGVKGLEDRYEVSNDGLVRTKPRILKPFAAKNGGHMQINLGLRRRSYVHRLVAESFLPNPKGKRVVHHKDGNPSNNCLGNLEWATHGENNADRWRRSTQHYATRRVQSVDRQGEIVKTFPSMTSAALATGVTKGAISSALKRHGTSGGYRWIYAP